MTVWKATYVEKFRRDDTHTVFDDDTFTAKNIDEALKKAKKYAAKCECKVVKIEPVVTTTA